MATEKQDMSNCCKFKYDEYWMNANYYKTMSQEVWLNWYRDNCGKCQYMSEICMYGEIALKQTFQLEKR